MRKTDKNKHISKGKKTFNQYTILGLCAVSVGVGGGIFLKKKIGPVVTDYAGFDPESFKADSKALLKEYEANPNKNFTPAELVNIGLEKYRSCEYSYSIGVGQASTIVNQSIRNAQIKNGDEFFEEQISRSSMVSLANRIIQEGENAKVYKGKANDVESAEYTSEFTNYSLDALKENLGKTLSEVFIYIISDNTVIKDKCSVTKTNENIKVELELDTEIATYYYKLQMKNLSNLSALPTFEHIKQTYIFDKNMTLLHSIMDEKYQASMSGITANIQNNLDYYYHANEYLKIPELNEQFDYSIEGEAKYE